MTKIPNYFHTEEDTSRMRTARAMIRGRLHALNPKGFRTPSRKRPWETTLLTQGFIDAGFMKQPKVTRSKRGKAKHEAKKAWLAKERPLAQHQSNWQRHHRGELPRDTADRRAAGGDW